MQITFLALTSFCKGRPGAGKQHCTGKGPYRCKASEGEGLLEGARRRAALHIIGRVVKAERGSA